MSTVAQARPMAAGWLEGETFDLAFILGIPLLAVGVAALGALDVGLFYMLVVADLWLLGYHHVVSTFTKLAGSVEDRRRNRALIWYLLPGMLAGTVALGFAGGVIAIVTLYFFWQWFHYVRQSWGIAQRYRHRAGGLAWDHPRLAEITMWSVPAWGLLHRCHQNPDAFLEMPVYLPPLPGVSRALIYYGACIAVSTVFYFGLQQTHRLLSSTAGLSSLSFLILFGMGINFHHYVVDGIIWKRRREVAPAT